jgi:uncharacterized protein YbaP (TraB family)
MELLIADESRDPQSKRFLDELVYHTNASAAQHLEVYLGTPNKYFGVVEAHHLIGDRIVWKLLQAKGYWVDQLVTR